MWYEHPFAIWWASGAHGYMVSGALALLAMTLEVRRAQRRSRAARADLAESTLDAEGASD